jgi:hypothetical protein
MYTCYTQALRIQRRPFICGWPKKGGEFPLAVGVGGGTERKRERVKRTKEGVRLDSNADPHHFDADPDPACHFDADLDPACKSDADPDPYSDPDPTFHFDKA